MGDKVRKNAYRCSRFPAPAESQRRDAQIVRVTSRPWPHVDLAQEYARKQLIHDEIDMC